MYKKLVNETLIYGIGAILPRLINFALVPLYTNKIDASEFSKFAQLYSLVAFVNIILTFGFETAYFRYSAEKSISHKVFHTSFWFVLANATAFLIGMYIFKIPIANYFNYQNNPEYLIWFAWIAFFDAVCMIPFALLRFTNQPIKYSSIKVFQGVFQTLLILAFFFLIPEKFLTQLSVTEKVSYPFMANLIASLSGVLLLYPIISKVRFVFDWKLFKTMFNYGYPVMLAGLAFTVNENLDKLIQRNMISETEAGAYAGCYKLAVIMALFVTAYRMGIEPFFFKKAQDEDAKKTYADVLQYFTVFCGAIIVGIIGNLSWIKHIFIRNDEYLVAIDIVPIIFIANFFFGIYYNLSTWYKVTDRTYVGTIISWVGAGLTILLNFTLIPIIGFKASAWATLIAYATMMIMSYFWGQKYYRIPYKTKKISFYVLLSIAFGVLAYKSFDNNFIIGNILFISYLAIAFFIEKSSLRIEKTKDEN